MSSESKDYLKYLCFSKIFLNKTIKVHSMEKEIQIISITIMVFWQATLKDVLNFFYYVKVSIAQS